MLVFHTAQQLRLYLNTFTDKEKIIGFVPTMGALHAGHMSLLQISRKQADLTVASIFVNPTQFNDKRDFENYPSTLPEDLKKLTLAGCDVLFLPTVQEMYPTGFSLETPYELGALETQLEGLYRPGHFQGVCQVVERLLHLVQPQYMFLGQKDYQQCMVLDQLVRKQPAFQSVQIVICPTLRESDGLAMSSRNMRLTPDQRTVAAAIYKALVQMKETLQPGSLDQLKKQAQQYLLEKGFRVDYAEIANAQTLELIKEWNGADPLVGLIAAFLGEVRLIDNIILTESRNSSNESV